MAVFGPHGWAPSVGWLAVLLALGLMTAPALVSSRFARLLPVPDRWRRRLQGPEFGVWRSVRVWIRAALWSLLLHVHQLAAAVVLGAALGLQVPSTYYLIFHPLVIVFGALPIGFSGFGVREMGYVWALAELQGVANPTALAFGLCWSTLLLAASGVGGVVVLVGGIRNNRM
jgi:uncharacterized membrane protein YbhN (UPF0104 family)